MRNHTHAAILIAVALILAGCSSANTADTTAVEAGTTVVETTTPPESTESTIKAEDSVVDNPGGLNGSYQLEWDPDELRETLGKPERTDEEKQNPEADPEAGVVIFTFDNGRLEAAWQTGPYAREEPEVVAYEVFRDRITIVFSNDVVDAAFELTDGQLRLSDFTVASGDGFMPVFLGTKPLTRIDGPTSAADANTG
jgi:hypothetical protein